MKCLKCKCNFSYRLVGTVYPGSKEKEDIICPYCNYNCGSIMTSQTVVTTKKDEESRTLKSTKDLLIEHEIEMMDDMTEGQLAEYLAEKHSDY